MMKSDAKKRWATSAASGRSLSLFITRSVKHEPTILRATVAMILGGVNDNTECVRGRGLAYSLRLPPCLHDSGPSTVFVHCG